MTTGGRAPEDRREVDPWVRSHDGSPPGVTGCRIECPILSTGSCLEMGTGLPGREAPPLSPKAHPRRPGPPSYKISPAMPSTRIGRPPAVPPFRTLGPLHDHRRQQRMPHLDSLNPRLSHPVVLLPPFPGPRNAPIQGEVAQNVFYRLLWEPFPPPVEDAWPA